MSKKFIAAITAATFCITAINAAPAQADGQDIAKVVVGSAFLLLLGKAIHDNNTAPAPHPAPQPAPATVHPHPHPHPQPVHPVHPVRPVTPTKHTRFLPTACLRKYDTSDGPQKYVSPNCLVKKHYLSHNLPRSCQTKVWTNHGVQNLYSPRCLRTKGFIFKKL